MTSTVEHLCQKWYDTDNERRGWYFAPGWAELSSPRKAEVRARVLDILRGEVRRSDCSEADLRVWNSRTVDLAWFERFSAPEPWSDDGRPRWFHEHKTITVLADRAPVGVQVFNHLLQSGQHKFRHIRYCYARPDLDSDVLPALEGLLRWSIVEVDADGQGAPRAFSLARLVERPEILDLELKRNCMCTMQLRFHYPCLLALEKVLARRDRERPPWAMSVHIEGVEWW